VKILLTVVTGYMIEGQLRESRSGTVVIHVDFPGWDQSLIQVISEGVDKIRMHHKPPSTPEFPDLFSVSHSILP